VIASTATSTGETPSATAAEMGPPESAFLVAYEDGRPVGCGTSRAGVGAVGELLCRAEPAYWGEKRL
jgi:hypothetical protein